MSFSSKLKRDRKAKIKNKNASHLMQKSREAHNKGVKVSSLPPSKTYKEMLYK